MTYHDIGGGGILFTPLVPRIGFSRFRANARFARAKGGKRFLTKWPADGPWEAAEPLALAAGAGFGQRGPPHGLENLPRARFLKISVSRPEAFFDSVGPPTVKKGLRPQNGNFDKQGPEQVLETMDKNSFCPWSGKPVIRRKS